MTIEASHPSIAGVAAHLQAPARFYDVLALATSVAPWSPAVLAAIEIAALWKSNVTGCYVPGSLRDQHVLEDEPTVLSLLIDTDDDCLADAAAFQAFARGHGATHASWMVTRTAIAPTLRKLGAWHDLAVLERDMVDDTRIFDILGEAMLSSRVPCLVLPPNWNRTLTFERIVIAWNGSIESTRAMHHALPLLQLAKSVVLIDGHFRTAHNRDMGVIEPDPMVYLMHHGITVKMHYLDVSAERRARRCCKKRAKRMRICW